MKPLQVDEEVFREWLLEYFDRMRDMETEVLVYRSAVEFLRSQVPPETCKTIDQVVAKTRQLPEIKQTLDEKYGRYRAQALECIEKGSQNQALSRYLQEWKARGPTN